MGLWGGLGSSVVSNIMMLNVLSIIYYGKTVFAKDGSEFCSLFFVSCLLPCAVDIIYGVGLAYPDNSPSITISAGYLYSALRLLSLAINFFAYALAEYKVNRMMGGKKLCDLSVQAISVRILVSVVIKILNDLNNSGSFLNVFTFSYLTQGQSTSVLSPASSSSAFVLHWI